MPPGCDAIKSTRPFVFLLISTEPTYTKHRFKICFSHSCSNAECQRLPGQPDSTWRAARSFRSGCCPAHPVTSSLTRSSRLRRRAVANGNSERVCLSMRQQPRSGRHRLKVSRSISYIAYYNFAKAQAIFELEDYRRRRSGWIYCLETQIADISNTRSQLLEAQRPEILRTNPE